jgi:hypothetical protein
MDHVHYTKPKNKKQIKKDIRDDLEGVVSWLLQNYESSVDIEDDKTIYSGKLGVILSLKKYASLLSYEVLVDEIKLEKQERPAEEI